MTINAYSQPEDICTAAMDRIGGGTINSISNPVTDAEATCARLYPLTVGMLLSRHDWNFANPVVQLAVNGDETPVGGYDYAFQLPSDLVAGPFAVYAHGDKSRPVLDYENANDHIHASFNICHIKYRRFAPPAVWPLYFTDLVVAALAGRLAKPVADDSGLQQELRIEAFGTANEDGTGGLFGAAKRTDAASQPIQSIFANGDPLTSTRY